MLRGELSPEGRGRDEETPAVLMLKLSARNESGALSAAISGFRSGPLELWL